jgi:hypothetical protein
VISAKDWPPPAVDPGVPSWSWASQPGEVKFCGESWFSSAWGKVIGEDGEDKWIRRGLDIEVLDAQVHLCEKDRQFGRVDGGKLRISGWVVTIGISESDVEKHTTLAKHQGKKYHHGEVGVSVYFDHGVDNLPQTELLLLHLGTGKNLTGGGTDAENGLVLLSVEGADNFYRRVGTFDIHGSKVAWMTIRSKHYIDIV